MAGIMRTIVYTTDNKRHAGDPIAIEKVIADSRTEKTRHLTDAEVLKSVVENLSNVLKNFRDLNYISLIINGNERFFNPVHVIYVDLDVKDVDGWLLDKAKEVV